MARDDEKRRRRALANAEATRRAKAAHEERVVDDRLRALLIEARDAIDASESDEIVEEESEISERLRLDPGVDLQWVETPAGYVFRYADAESRIWELRLTWSALHSVCAGATLAVSMRETS